MPLSSCPALYENSVDFFSVILMNNNNIYWVTVETNKLRRNGSDELLGRSETGQPSQALSSHRYKHIGVLLLDPAARSSTHWAEFDSPLTNV